MCVGCGANWAPPYNSYSHTLVAAAAARAGARLTRAPRALEPQCTGRVCSAILPSLRCPLRVSCPSFVPAWRGAGSWRQEPQYNSSAKTKPPDRPRTRGASISESRPGR
eukprot:scaffold20251_cov108-Isochrysis_galbana.AAC.3